MSVCPYSKKIQQNKLRSKGASALSELYFIPLRKTTSVKTPQRTSGMDTEIRIYINQPSFMHIITLIFVLTSFSWGNKKAPKGHVVVYCSFGTETNPLV